MVQTSIFDFLKNDYKITKPIRLIELFAGIGSQAKALENLGANFEHYRVVEFDKYAIASYNAVHGTNFETSDITQVSAKDLAIEEKGRFYLTGRKDDLIVSSSGENINPNLYEYCFNIKHVKKVCLIDAKKKGQAYPVILVSVVKYISIDTQEWIIQEVKEKLKELNLLSEIKEVVLIGEDLIKGNEFKLNRKRLVEEYNNGKLNLLSSNNKKNIDTSFDEIEQIVAKCFEKVLDKDVDKNADFFVDVGGTSLEYFTLITYLQEEFDLVIPLSNEKKLTSINEFSAYIKGNM
jgi:acyl carrier protein